MKKALVFGINDYPGSYNDLQGCVNDVHLVPYKINSLDGKHKRMRHGADTARLAAAGLRDLDFAVRMLLNEEVTVARFKGELLDAFRNSQNGDYLVVWYSGHGTQVPDRSGDEPDGYDEALYLFDGPFIDDDLQSVIREKPAGVFLFLGMDCCFSGTNTKNLKKKARFKPWVKDMNLDAGGNLKLRLKRRFLRNYEMDYVVLTGCAESQTSADAYIDGKWQGAMTYYAMKTLTGGITYQEWYKRIRRYLPSSTFDQVPQLEGSPEMIKTGVFGTGLHKRGCLLKFL